ncbi:phosphonate C-P lyase system protein PhnH [Desulfolithobacter sp.]
MISREIQLEQTNRRNFRVCLETLARPGTTGTILPICGSHLLALAYCLLYPEVTSCFYAPGDQHQLRALTGSPEAPPDRADYIFCDQDETTILTGAKTGTLMDPEQSATLFIQAGAGKAEATRVLLSGPGINGSLAGSLPVSGAFLSLLQEKNSAFPLGVDCFFLDRDGKMTGLARTTMLEIIQ